MREPPTPVTYEHVFRNGLLGNLGCVSLFGLPILAGVGKAALELPPSLGIALAVVAALALVGFAAWLSGDTITRADANGLVRKTVRRIGPFSAGESVEIDLRWDEIAKATSTRHHRVTKHGDFACREELSFGKNRVIRAELVGGVDDPNGYRALVAFVKARLGDRFTEEDDFGTLGAALVDKLKRDVERGRG